MDRFLDAKAPALPGPSGARSESAGRRSAPAAPLSGPVVPRAAAASPRAGTTGARAAVAGHRAGTAEPRVGRRTVLVGAAQIAGALAVVPAARAQEAVSPVFRHGVASGDPLPDAVILWTRVTPTADALPGSGRGPAVTVRWEIATDPAFGAVVASGTVTTGPDADHTVKVDATALAPATGYHYRFTALGETSPAGRTRTAPAPGDDPGALRFAVVSCSNWEAGWFGAYRHLAARDDLDAVIHLGDYLYEYAAGGYGGRDGTVRPHEPAHTTLTPADYRIRHAQYKTDPDLRALHAAVPFVCTWDDHESADNSWSGGAPDHHPARDGDWRDRRAASVRAYLEWMPVRPAGTGTDPHIYRRLRFGTLAELTMLDLRSYRDQQVGPDRAVDDPQRTLTGRAQLAWLTDGLRSAPTRWKLVGNSVMIAPLLLPPLPADVTAALTTMMGVPREGVVVNTDQWDGYAADRARLFTALADAAVADVVFLTGDIHSSWAADLPLDAAAYPTGRTVGAEFVVPSVTSASLGELLGAPPRTAAVPVEQAIAGVNRHLRYVELESHGYGVLEVTAERARMDWFYLLDVTDPSSAVRHGYSLAVPAGGRVGPA